MDLLVWFSKHTLENKNLRWNFIKRQLLKLMLIPFLSRAKKGLSSHGGGVVVWVSLHGWAWYPGHLLRMKEGRISQQHVSPLIISPFPFCQICPHYTYLTDSRSWKLSLEVPFPSPKWSTRSNVPYCLMWIYLGIDLNPVCML